MGDTGFGAFKTNIRKLPGTLKEVLFRHGPPSSARSRALAIFSNVFLHIHPTRANVRSLRFSATWGVGMASALLFLILSATGILLMVYYKPSVGEAYNSIKDIHYVVPTGRFIRNIHRWAAHLMVITVLVHMCRVFYSSCYKRPREFNWVIGMGLFVLTLALSFTGYLLPWDQLAYWATTIGANIAGSPTELTDALHATQYTDPGGLARQVLLGSSAVGEDSLIRFYLLHVIVLPLALVLLMAAHFWRIRKDGGLGRPGAGVTAEGKGAAVEGSPPVLPESAPRKTYGLMCIVRDRAPATNQDPEDTVPSWPYLLRYELVVLMVCVLATVILGMCFDAPLKEPANPMLPENPAKAPWYFLGLQEMVSYSAFMGGVGIPGLVLVGLGLIPFLDRKREEVGVYFGGPEGRRLVGRTAAFALAAAALAVVIPVSLGWIREWWSAVPQIIVILVNPGTLLTGAYIAWSLHAMKKHECTRMGALALFTCFIVGFIVLTYVGTYLRGPNWDFYWSRADWPVH